MNVLMILNGPSVSVSTLLEFAGNSDFIIAADGGAQYCWEAAIKPDRVIGDMDSVEITKLPPDWAVSVDSDQETTDFEKALAEIPPARKIKLVIVGGLGGRIDHELTNLHIASRLNPNWAVEFHSDNTTLYRCLSTLTLNIPIGDTLSLIPWSVAKGVTTSGLEWNLNHGELSATQKLGQSNCVSSSPVSIRVEESGILYVVHPFNCTQNPSN